MTHPQHAEQQMPTPNGHPSIQSLMRADVRHRTAWTSEMRAALTADLDARERIGVERYGTALQPFNGRDALRDLYEELIDGALYARQAMVEEEDANGNSLRRSMLNLVYQSVLTNLARVRTIIDRREAEQ